MGKTTLGVQMCLSIASGTAFLDFPIERQPKILYCYLEGDPQGMAKLLRQQLEGWGEAIKDNVDEDLYLVESRGLQLETQSGFNLLAERIAKTQAQLVVIDPISKAMSRDMNRLENVTGFVNRLDAFNRDLGVDLTWLFVHHYGKPTAQARQPIHEMLGSSGWGNYTESFIGMERWSERRSPDYKRISFDIRHGPPLDEICVYLNRETRLFEVVDSPEAIPSLKAARVEAILSEYGEPATFTKLRTLVEMELGISESQAKRLITEAREGGLIIKEGSDRFAKYITADGEKMNLSDSNIIQIKK
jgi:hypothetical protein